MYTHTHICYKILTCWLLICPDECGQVFPFFISTLGFLCDRNLELMVTTQSQAEGD